MSNYLIGYLKQNLSKVIKEVQGGKSALIFKRSEAVAELRAVPKRARRKPRLGAMAGTIKGLRSDCWSSDEALADLFEGK